MRQTLDVFAARRSSTPAASRGSDANSGCASQRSRNASTPSRSISLREPLVGRRAAPRVRRRRRCRATRSTSTSSSHEVGSIERELQAQPPALRVADVRRAPALVASACAVATKSRPSGTRGVCAAVARAGYAAHDVRSA